MTDETEKHPSQRDNYWEPFFKKGKTIEVYLDQNDDHYRPGSTIDSKRIKVNYFHSMESSEILDVTFDSVDLFGELECDTRKKFHFKNCKFNDVAFNKTRWENVKFEGCAFRRTSFSLASFKSCDFRRCIFDKIGVSSKEMIIVDCYIEPKIFLSAVSTNYDEAILKENEKTKLYQEARLCGTKSAVANKLLENPAVNNDDRLLQEAMSLSILLPIAHKILQEMLLLSEGKSKSRFWKLLPILTHSAEYALVVAIGSINGWGRFIVRPLLIGGLACLALAFYYFHNLPNSPTYGQCLLRSVEYWLLFGYTKYSFEGVSAINQCVILLNGMLGMFWFAIIIPVLIRRTSHVK